MTNLRIPAWRAVLLIVGISFSICFLPISSAAGSTVSCVASRKVTKSEKNMPFFQQMVREGYSTEQDEICLVAHLSGPIEDGDAARIEAFIIANLPFLMSLELNSSGGNLAESIKIGRLSRRFYLRTHAPQENGFGPSWVRPSPEIYISEPNAICASACFFVWLGGINRDGDFIGIHRPFSSASEMRRMSPAQADRMYRDVSNIIRAYLAEIGVAPHWLDDMMRIGSEDIHMLSKQEKNELFAPELGDTPSIAQWKSAQCGSLSSAEYKDLYRFIDLYLKKLPVPKKQRSYKENLERRWGEILVCGEQSLILARWRSRESSKQR